jgi:hypothetical protein
MSYMNSILSQVGENVTILEVTQGSVDKYGDRTDTTTTRTVRGHIQILTSNDDEVVEGNFKSGDMRAFFDKTAPYIDEGNKIVYRGKTYIMDEVILEPAVNDEAHYDVYAKKT